VICRSSSRSVNKRGNGCKLIVSINKNSKSIDYFMTEIDGNLYYFC
jgi:hypothetical protein